MELCFGNALQYGHTALIAAARHGHTEIVNILLHHRANIEAADTVRHLICEHHFEVELGVISPSTAKKCIFMKDMDAVVNVGLYSISCMQPQAL